MVRLTSAQVKEISRTYFKECLKRFREYEDSHEENRMGLPSSVYEEHENGITVEQAVADIVAPFANDSENVETGAYLFRMTEHVLEAQGIEGVNEESRSYKALAREGLEKVQNEFRNLIKQHANYKLEYEISNPEWFGDLLSDSVPTPSEQVVTVEDSSELISFVHEKYMEEMGRSVSARTIEKKMKSYAVWLELHGDRKIQAFAKAHGRKFKETLMAIPKNAGVKYRGKTLQELLNLNVKMSDRLESRTVNYYLTDINRFFNWAINNGYYEGASPVANLKVTINSNAQEERDPFSNDQLKSLFSSPIYRGCKSGCRLFIREPMV